MSIGPVNNAGTTAPMNFAITDNNVPDRQIIGAVQQLNQSELMGQGRELSYRRDPKTGHFVIQIVRRDTGAVVDQIPPEVLLRLQAEFQQELQGKESHA